MVRETVRKLYQSGKPSDELMALPVSEVGLPNFVVSVLRYNGFKTVEDLYKSVKADPEEIFKLQGTTPSVMDDIASLVRLVEDRRNAEANPAPAQEEAAEPEAPAADSERETDEPAPSAESESGEAAEDLAAETTVTAPASESAAESEPEEDVSFDDLFKLIPVASEIDYSEDFGEVSGDSDRKKKKKGRRKNTEIEYDPDSDSTVVRKKHRRGDEDWGW